VSSQLGYARLTGSEEPEVPGGGIPLPGAFHGILYYLMNNDRVALEDILVKVVRENVGELHENRVRHVWGSWEALGRDLLDQLEDRGYVTRRGTVWMLAPEFRGGRVKVLYYSHGHRELRVTVRSREEHETRELLARARARLQDYRVQLEAWGLYQGKVKTTLDRHAELLRWDGEQDEALDEALDEVLDETQDGAQKGSRTHPYGAVAAFTRKYLKREYPRWVTAADVARAFNATFPDGHQIPGHQPFDRLMVLVTNGLAERKVDTVHEYRGRPKVLFRWRQDEVG